MYLIDTNVISELRKKAKMDSGVRAFFDSANKHNTDLYISVITVGELWRGAGLIRHRGDEKQAKQLELWLNQLIREYDRYILPFDIESSQVWAALRVPHYENALDKQIAATAIIYDLALVTRNTKDFKSSGLELINPFENGQP